MQTQSHSETMKRGDFLRSLGLSSAALMSLYCLGTLTACSRDDDDPQPSTPTTPTSGLTGNATTSAGQIDFTLDLANTNYNALRTEGSFVRVGDVIVANTRGGTFVALSRACTHQGTSVQYRLAQNDFWCDNHGSEFSLTGAVERGPAASPLRQYTTSLSGNSLRVRQ